MRTIKVQLVYPVGFSLESKDIQLNDLELNVLLNSKKVGSEGKYFLIKDIIFEDYEDEEGKYSATVILKSSN